MSRDGRPALVVDASVTCHLEVLCLAPLGSFGIVERVRHADALDRPLLDAVYGERLGETGDFENGRRDVDDMMKLGADLSLTFDSLGPMHDGAVAGAAEVRGDLLGPLVGRVHGVCPSHRVVVVGLDPAELVQSLRQKLGGLQLREARQWSHLVEAALERTLRRGAVVADDQINQRVFQNAEIRERIHEPTDVMVGMLHEAGINLHLANQDRLHDWRDGVPGRNFGMPCGERAIRRDDAEFLLPCEGFLAQLVPALVELAFVLVRPLLRHVMRRVRRAGREVGEKWLVRHERLLLPDPFDCLGGHIVGKVIALLRCLLGLDWSRAFVERWIPLVGLAADEAVKVLEAAAAAGPGIVRAHGARLPDRYFVALAEL